MKRLTKDEFMALLNRRVTAAGSQAQFAQSNNLSAQYVCDVLKNRRSPGPKVLSALGLREIRLYERTDDKDEG